MSKKVAEYVEPKSYFNADMRRAALEYDRDNGVEEETILTPNMQLRLVDWLVENGIDKEKAWEALDYMMFGDEELF